MALGPHDVQQLTPTEVADLLASVDITTVWDEADERERRVLIEDLVDAVYVYPDHLRVVACGAPPL